ncbi:nuclear transport factor 2 family protein [Ancylobacter sp. Lp-2]|uniref:nuclear transport factor 2 family protein n=1 Tax=Ancylobacter sp. Lp-2 TaxID=2881339 RepID=UPI001E32BE00|nr:nuclear transport factor 2 family protein [Ancylobacter sp. Lp-2]MCB4770764.1 nuclear transport factor 2 family protein [Ancylobacter sp. Lp-2]
MSEAAAVEEIAAAEERLRRAALAGDVAALDALLADDLVFVNFVGHVLNKQDDLDLHRSGALKLSRTDFSELGIRLLDAHTAHTVLRVDAEGIAGGAPFTAALRFSRVWRRGAAGWQVMAIHSCAIA